MAKGHFDHSFLNYAYFDIRSGANFGHHPLKYKKDTYIIDDFVEGIGKVLKKQILQIDLHAKNPVEKF